MSEKAIKKITIERLKRAKSNLDDFSQLRNAAEETATVKAFEYSYEMSWKALKKILTKQGVETTSPRDVFRQAAAAKLIEDPEPWFEYIRMRNVTAHTYVEDVIKELATLLPEFKILMAKLIKTIEEWNNSNL